MIQEVSGKKWLYRPGLSPLWYSLDSPERTEALASCADDPVQCRQTLDLVGPRNPPLRAVLQGFLDYPEDARAIADPLWDLAQEQWDAEDEPFLPQTGTEEPAPYVPTMTIPRGSRPLPVLGMGGDDALGVVNGLMPRGSRQAE
jgi:hypothetical protein